MAKPVRVSLPAWFAVRAYASKPSLRQIRALNQMKRLQETKLPEDRGAYDVTGRILGAVRVTECSLQPKSKPVWHTRGKYACVIDRVVKFSETIPFPSDVRRKPFVSLDNSRKYRHIVETVRRKTRTSEEHTNPKGRIQDAAPPPSSPRPPVSPQRPAETKECELRNSESFRFAAKLLSSSESRALDTLALVHPCRVRLQRAGDVLRATVTTCPKTKEELDRIEKARPLRINIRDFLRALRLVHPGKTVLVPNCPYLSL